MVQLKYVHIYCVILVTYFNKENNFCNVFKIGKAIRISFISTTEGRFILNHSY